MSDLSVAAEPTPAAAFRETAGTVVEFDDHAGYGEAADGSGRRWPFHCTAIADGTRTIAVGTAVRFDLVPGRLGRWEAANLRPA